MSKEELRRRIERDPQLTKDFDFLIAQTGLTAGTASDRSPLGLQPNEGRAGKRVIA